MKTICKTAVYTTFLLLLVSMQALTPVMAAENDSIDFSCMKEQVRPIIQVTDRYQEFDVIVRNQCPGNAYWSMCIERLDPWTQKILENHTPTGYTEAEKRGRVNLQMKATHNAEIDVSRAQEFYVAIAYGIEKPQKAQCVARACEAKKTDLRTAVRKNTSAWHSALKALDAKILSECPDHGWNTPDTQACRDALAEAQKENLAMFEQKDQELREQMAAIDPETCMVYGGNILKLK